MCIVSVFVIFSATELNALSGGQPSDHPRLHKSSRLAVAVVSYATSQPRPQRGWDETGQLEARAVVRKIFIEYDISTWSNRVTSCIYKLVNTVITMS